MLSDRAFVLVKGKEPKNKPIDWKINPFENSELFLPVVKILESHGWTGDIYCPKPVGFTARLCRAKDFNRQHLFDGHRILWGPIAEGMTIPNGTTLRLTSADCATIVVTHQKEDIVIAAHAGFKSLIDQPYATGRQDGEERPSVVDKIMDEVRRYNPGIKLDGLLIEIIASISGKNFHYSPYNPTFGRDNRRVLEYLKRKYPKHRVIVDENSGGIDIPTIIKAQFARHNVPIECIEQDDEKVDTPDNPDLWSRSRKEVGSNLILIHHYR